MHPLFDNPVFRALVAVSDVPPGDHSYYEFLFVQTREINPKCIIEVGVLHGLSLAVLRAAAPEAHIIGIDDGREHYLQYGKAKIDCVLDAIGLPTENWSFIPHAVEEVDFTVLPQPDMMHLDGPHDTEPLTALMNKVWDEFRGFPCCIHHDSNFPQVRDAITAFDAKKGTSTEFCTGVFQGGAVQRLLA